ncbi:MAG TPA: hypothetical protein VFB68_18625 [Xanthobacteraceae bacterium]|nr:hypothetical protein [Xanthobacteraceae bacterium]
MIRWILLGALLRPERQIFAACIFSLVLPAAAASQERPYVHRGLFYSGTSHGALAWVDGVNSFDTARRRLFVYDLSASKCHTLPHRSQYWFLVNNRGINDAASIGYFAVRAVARPAKARDASYGLILYRNAGWLTSSGATLPELSGANRLSVKQFVQLHDDAADAGKTADDRLEQLNAGLGGTFHALVARDQPSSWSRRSVFALQKNIDELEPDPLFYWASLTRFAASDQTPMVFYLNNPGIGTMRISLDGSNLGFPMQPTELRIGQPCP